MSGQAYLGANAVQGNAREVRAIFLVATAAAVATGASVSTAFGSGGGTYAICASIIVLMAIGLQIWGSASGAGSDAEEFRSVVRYRTPNIAAMGLLIIGGFLYEGPSFILELRHRRLSLPRVLTCVSNR